MKTAILIDVTRLILRSSQKKRATGVDRVGLAYIEYYQDRAYAVLSWGGRVIVLSKRSSKKVFADLLSDQVKPKIYWYTLLSRLLLARIDYTYKGAVLFNTGHKGLESEAYTRALNRMGVRPLFFVHDLIPITHPEYCRPGEKEKHELRMLRMISDACGLIANSQYTVDEALKFADSRSLSCPPIMVSWLASNFVPSLDLQNHNSEKVPHSKFPYFVMLSTIEPRKNHLLLLQVWRKIVEEYGVNSSPKLVIVGQRGWECEQVIDLLERCEALRNVVIEKNNCTDIELQALLKDARALLFPSFVEGFGMPLVEALLFKTPVIASDIPVFREVGQNIPDLIDETDGVEWKRVIMEYTQDDSNLRTKQLLRMRDYHPWSWHNHFQVVDQFIEAITNG